MCPGGDYFWGGQCRSMCGGGVLRDLFLTHRTHGAGREPLGGLVSWKSPWTRPGSLRGILHDGEAVDPTHSHREPQVSAAPLAEWTCEHWGRPTESDSTALCGSQKACPGRSWPLRSHAWPLKTLAGLTAPQVTSL